MPRLISGNPQTQVLKDIEEQGQNELPLLWCFCGLTLQTAVGDHWTRWACGLTDYWGFVLSSCPLIAGSSWNTLYRFLPSCSRNTCTPFFCFLCFSLSCNLQHPSKEKSDDKYLIMKTITMTELKHLIYLPCKGINLKKYLYLWSFLQTVDV